jgi:hypothetical protein
MKYKGKQLIGIALIGVVMSLAVTMGLKLSPTATAQTSCPPQDSSRGTVTSTFNVATSGSYNVWVRMAAQSATNDSVILEVDSTTCNVIMGDISVPTTGWKWVNYRNASTTNTVSVSLSAGSHSLKLIGREDGVKVDRVLFVPQDANCVPQDADKGNSCAGSFDTEVPKTAMTAPKTGDTISGTYTLQASASDDIAVSKVDFYAGTKLIGSDNTATNGIYTLTINTAGGSYPNGSYEFTSVAFDTSSPTPKQTRSTVVTANIYNAPTDTTKPTVSITSPLANQEVSGTINVIASAADNAGGSGMDKVEFTIDGGTTPVNTDNASPYSFFYDTTALSNGIHTITAKAFDKRGNNQTATVSVTVKNGTVSVSCDFNADGSVSLVDLSVLLTNYGKAVTPNKSGDCSGDGQVTLVDLSKLLTGYGK